LAVNTSTNTVVDLRDRLVASGCTEQDLQDLDDKAWVTALGTQDRSIAVRKKAPDWQWVHQEMARPSATLEALWREWRETCPDGIGYTQFSTLYREWKKTLNVVMRQTHAPADKLFVDFAGQTVEVRDPEGGPSLFAQVFVAVLGYSNLTYVEAVASQTTPDWIQCHINCFEAIGGAPRWVVCDNLKAGVVRREREQIVINPAYADALRHFRTAAAPARPYRPRDKGSVEVGVQIAQRWILFRLRNRIFFSLAELNTEIHRLCEELNCRPFRHRAGSRRQRFEDGERAELMALPVAPYEVCEWRYEVKVGADYHVEHLGSYYSVPFQLAHQRVDVRATRSLIELFSRGRRVAVHALAISPGQPITCDEHRPISHVRVLEGEPKALLAWAETVGPQARDMMRYHLEQRTDEFNGLRTARSLRDLARAYGNQRFEEVCAYALRLNIRTLRALKAIFSDSTDRRAGQTPQGPTNARPQHENLRGAEYYGDKT
jgi:transposase